jgi:hypothetical protein
MTELPAMETFTPPPLSPEDMGGEDLADLALQESLWPTIETLKEDIPPSAGFPEDARAAKKVGDTIPIATTVDIDEWWPAVAHGGDYYMVVYEREGKIYGKVYSNTGTLKNTITIANFAEEDCGYPSVAYEAKSGLFVVVYEYNTSSADHDVFIQVVSPTTGRVGGTYWVSNDPDHERYPDVACKHTNGTCLVAFQQNQEGRIKGRFVTITSSGLTAISTVRDFSNATGASFPHVAWGVGTGLYMVTYDWFAGKNYAAYTKVYDDPVSSGDQYVHTNATVAMSLPNDTFNSDVTYDPCTEKFLISFYHLFSAADRDLWVVAKQSTASAEGFTPFTIASTPQNEHRGAISFVTDSHLEPFCGSMDNLAVAYLNDSVGVMAAELRGNSSTTNPIYVRDATDQQLIVDRNTTRYTNKYTAISSGSQKGELFIAFSGQWKCPPSEWSDLDVYGQIVAISGRVYLPLILR